MKNTGGGGGRLKAALKARASGKIGGACAAVAAFFATASSPAASSAALCGPAVFGWWRGRLIGPLCSYQNQGEEPTTRENRATGRTWLVSGVLLKDPSPTALVTRLLQGPNTVLQYCTVYVRPAMLGY